MSRRGAERPDRKGLKPRALAGAILGSLALVACDQSGDDRAGGDTAQGNPDDNASAAPAQPPKPDGPVTYDPASCPQDADGMVYVTFYGSVFRFAPQEALMRGLKSPGSLNVVPSPSNPNAPLGCPEHPIPSATLPPLDYKYAGIAADPAAPRAGRLEQFRMLSVVRGFWATQFSDAEFALEKCRDGEVLPVTDALRECRKPGDKSGSYIADPLEYTAPYGQLFVVNCLPGGALPEECRVSYKLHHNLNVTYRFKPQNIPLTSVLEADKQLRSSILAAYVPKYSTPMVGRPEPVPAFREDG